MNDLDRRAAILHAASRLFHHYGPFKTTVADIAREARVGVGTVYLEFRNKDAILAALSRTRHERVLTAVEAAWGDGRPAPARLERALIARVEAFLGCASDGAHGADLFRCACPAVEETHRAYVVAEHALFARFLGEASARGELEVEDPAEDARGLLLAFRVFEPPLVFELPADARMQQLRVVHRLVVQGLLPRERRRAR